MIRSGSLILIQLDFERLRNSLKCGRNIFKKSKIEASDLFIKELFGHLNSFVRHVSLGETPLLKVSDNIFDPAKQEHSTVGLVILCGVHFLHFNFMIPAIKPVCELHNVGKNFTC